MENAPGRDIGLQAFAARETPFRVMNNQRHVHQFLVDDEAVADEIVVAERLAMIRRDDDNRVVQHMGALR